MTYTLFELFNMYEKATERAQRHIDYRGSSRGIGIATDRHARKFQKYNNLAWRLRAVLIEQLRVVDRQAEKTAQLKAMADCSRDNGFGAVYRDRQAAVERLNEEVS